MSGKLGEDFNASQPTDDGLVKQGAMWIRDIKNRLKSWAGVLFNLETGQLKENVLESKNLKDIHTDDQTWNRVVVNKKGLVVEGELVDTAVAAEPKQYFYGFLEGKDPDGSTIAKVAGADDDALTIATYTFTVPEGVSKIFVQCQAAGGGGGYNATPNTAGGGAGGNYQEAFIPVTEGDLFLVWVGQGGTGGSSPSSVAIKGSISKFEFDVSKYLKTGGGGLGGPTANGAPSTVLTAAGIVARSQYGGIGSPYAGGAAGSGAPDNGTGVGYGNGGTPKATSPANNGSHGFVSVTYWVTNES